MLAEAVDVKKIVIACGRTDLRKGVDGLAQLIGTRYDLNLTLPRTPEETVQLTREQ